MRTPSEHKPFYAHLYFQVLLAILIGVLLGHFFPNLATKMKPLGEGFIKLIKMMIAPIIFTTVVSGIAKVSDMKEVGRVGLKALIYFEVVSTLALAIGLVDSRHRSWGICRWRDTSSAVVLRIVWTRPVAL